MTANYGKVIMTMEILTACLMVILGMSALGIGMGVAVKMCIFIIELGEKNND